MPHDIFISYSRRDLAAVKPIKEQLESLGFSCWMDLEGIESGSEEFTNAIVNSINNSAVVLFFLSRASQESRWSLNELRLARRKKKRVVMILFNDDAMLDKFILEFGGADIIDWRVAVQKEKLLRDLAKWLEKESFATKADGPAQPIRRKENRMPMPWRNFAWGVLLTVLLLFALLALLLVFAPNTSRAIGFLLLQLFRR